MALERIQKIMAAAGVASRRKSEELITAGRVSVNGQVITELGAKADADTDHIRVDGKLLHGRERKLYLLLNKPKGYVSTVSDPEGRPTVMDLVRSEGTRLYPIGRLDYASEGLLLLTNDGELAQKLTRASSHVPKTYLVKVSGQPSEDSIARLRAGIVLRPDRPGDRTIKTAPALINLSRDAENPWYEVTLTEGRNRQIRRMFEQVGNRVEKIKRIRYGPLELDVPPGEFRRLSEDEVTRLQRGGPGRPLRPAAPDDKRPAARREQRAGGQRNARDYRPRDDRERRPPNAEGISQGDRRPFRPRDERERRPRNPEGAPQGDRRPFRPRDDRERRPRNPEGAPQGDRRPFRPRDDRERRPPNAGNRPQGDRRPFRARDDRERRPRNQPDTPRRDDRGPRPGRGRRPGPRTGTKRK